MLIPTYITYLVVSMTITIAVAEVLRRNGRRFLVGAFGGDLDLADSVNLLLVVGFYLINAGFVTLFLVYGERPTDVNSAFEYVVWKVGVVCVVLGFMHFFNVFNFAKMHRKGQIKTRAELMGAGRVRNEI